MKHAPPESFESIRIDKRSGVPAYLQIAAGIRTMIQQAALPAGYPLPPERVLCEAYGVSRMTLRQAISMLEREGLVVSYRGRGTFVAHERLKKQQQEFRSFTEEIRSRGGKPQSRLISFEELPADFEAQEFFRLRKDQKIYKISRLRLDDDVPLAVEVARLPKSLCPSLDSFDLEKNSLYSVLEQSYGLRLESCIEEISAERPSSRDRKLLVLPKAGVVLAIRRKTFTDIGQPVELTRTVYRGDLYSAIVHSIRKI